MASLGGSDGGSPVQVSFRRNGKSVGRRDNLTHWIHWYPAKMFHRIPSEILGTLKLPLGSSVLDPFCGSGTVVLEGARHGYRTIGIDINPLAQLITRVKTTPVDPQHLIEHLPDVLTTASALRAIPQSDAVFDFWFKPEARDTLYNLRRAIAQVAHPLCRRFFLVCFTAIVRRSSLADPSIAPPVRLQHQRVAKANARYKKALEWSDTLDHLAVLEMFESSVRTNIRRMAELHAWPNLGKVVVPPRAQASRSGLGNSSVDLVVTSPPYCGAQKYVRSLRLEMLWLGIPPKVVGDFDRRTLGTERTRDRPAPSTGDSELDATIRSIAERNSIRAVMLAEYVEYLVEFGREMYRVIRPGGQAFVTFGTSLIAGISVDLARVFARIASNAGFETVGILVDSIPSRGFITKRHKTSSVINDEQVVWLRRP